MSRVLTSIGEFFALWRFTRIAFVVLALLLAIGIWKLFFSQNGDAENYLTATVERGEIQNLVTATGVLQPREYVDVGAQVSGQLRKLLVVVGQQVKAGDLLAEIDATVFRAKVDGIRAQLQNQQAQLGDRKAQLTLAQIRIDRQQNLFKDEATTKEAVQVAEASFQSAGAQLKALQAQIQQTESSLRAEEANLAYARIYAPMSGTVVSITSRQGQTLNANNQAPTIMRIADLSTMTVQTQVSEADIGKLHVGMPVYFTTLGGQDYRWYSKLNRVEPTPQVTNNVVLYNALFDVPNENGALMTSMSTQVFFIAAQARDALVIPASALNFKPRKSGEPDEDKKSWNDKNPKDEAAKKNEESKKKSDKDKSSDGTKEVAGEDRWAPKGGQRRAPPSATDEVKPKSATVQVMDEKGNLTERNIMVGISSRVRVQVLEGLQEGEKVVSGMRQQEKANSSSQGATPGAPGMGGAGGGGARQMR